MRRLWVGVILPALVPMAALAGERTVTLAVDNMTCALCPITVSKAIDAVDGVVKVTVDYAAKRAVVRYDDTAATWKRIAEASTNAGFPARKVE